MISLVIQYSKISVNMPMELLKEFDKICEVHSYSRAEGIKEAVRQFIIEQMPEEYYSPQMKQVMNESIKEQGMEFVKGMAQAAVDPEVQKLQMEGVKQMAQQGAVEGIKYGIEERLHGQGIKLSDEQRLQLAQRLQFATEKTNEMQNEKKEAKQSPCFPSFLLHFASSLISFGVNSNLQASVQ